MRLLLAASLVTCTLLTLFGCGTPKVYQSKLDPLALQQMQTQEFETSKKILFASVVSVFQDTGFIIETSDFESGIVTAKSATTSAIDFFGTTNGIAMKASAFVEDTRAAHSKARLNFIESTDSRARYGGGGTSDIPIEIPAYYEKIFNKIREGVFIREANKATDPVK